MKVIMLSGKKNCGKSTTLNLVYDYINPAMEDIISPKSILGNPKYRDFECIIRYQNKTVAFYTMGDFPDMVCDAITKYDKLNCDILVCACNARFAQPHQQIKNYLHAIIKKRVIHEASDSERQCANETDKTTILEEISK
jgi:hypothetical protein